MDMMRRCGFTLGLNIAILFFAMILLPMASAKRLRDTKQLALIDAEVTLNENIVYSYA